MRGVRIAVVAVGCLAALWGQPKAARFVGAQRCGTCHREQFARQSASGHAQALHRAAEHPLAGSFAPKGRLLRKPNYRSEFLRDPEQFRIRASDDENFMDIPVEWAFGSGEQAVTFVSRVDEDWYLEHYYSYYTALGSLAPTPGQDGIQPKTLPEAVGLLYKTLDPNVGIVGCFECHSTGPLSVSARRELQPAERGVRCESCHGPGSLHVETTGRAALQNPRRLSAAELNKFCGRCHRPPAGEGVAIDWNYAWNVRHQPVYFSQSACFRKSKGVLSCLTCHDPHQPLRKNDASYYNQRCVSCHAVTKGGNCIDCHMPRVAPQPPLRFSNHWIGVYKDGAKLRPAALEQQP